MLYVYFCSGLLDDCDTFPLLTRDISQKDADVTVMNEKWD